MAEKKVEQFDFKGAMKSYFTISPYVDIITWCKDNIDFSEQISAQRNKLDFELYPYQVPILKEWENKEKVIKTIVVVAPEQTGKTGMFVDGLLWNMVHNPCQSLIVYPSDDLANSTNSTKLRPLMKHIDVLNRQLTFGKYNKECYKFSNLISWFQGAGRKIVSKSCKIVVGDEIDAWPTLPTVDNVEDLKKRTRSYDSSICFLISTPTTADGRIWKQFLKGSQGYWYLRCKGCGQLTMRSCDIHNLQFESDLNEQLGQRIVKTDSIRLICPKCGHEHIEADKRQMNIKGGFIHSVPERVQISPSFQIGALASQLPSLCWTNICQAQLEAGKRSDIDAHMTLDNSFKGLPYKRRQIVKEDLDKLKDHIYQHVDQQLKTEQIQFIFGAVDSMDTYWRYGIFAADIHDNVHVIKIGEVKYLSLTDQERMKIDKVGQEQSLARGEKYEKVVTLQDIINKSYYGYQPLVVGIDAHAGHNFSLVNQFIKKHKCMVGYLGTKMVQLRYKPSDNKNLPRNFLVSAQHYKVDTIFYLYSQKKRDAQYLFFYKDIEQKYLDEIASMKPDYNSKFGHIPENWTTEQRADHAFDVIKMGYWVRDLSIQNLQQKRFNYAQSARLKRRFQKNLQKEVLQTRKQIEDKNRDDQLDRAHSWFEI